MNVTKLSRLAFALTIALWMTACGSKSIDLQKAPGTSAPPPPPSTKPAPGSPSNPTPNPEKPERPTPAPGEPVVARYRLVCEAGGGPGRTTFVSTDANSRPFDPFADLDIGAFTTPNKSTPRAGNVIVEAYNPILIPGADLDTLDLFFVGVKPATTQRRFYRATASSVLRTGKATELGSEPSLDGGVRSAADSMGLTAANYGASSAGRFILLPGSGGFKVMNRDGSKTVGTISASTSRTILPRINEETGVFTALVYNGKGFSPVVQKLSISSSSVSVSKKFDLGFSGATSSVVQTFDAKSVAWVESSSTRGSSAIKIAKLDLVSGHVTRADYRATARGARIYPQAAITQTNGSPVINIAVESVQVKSSSAEITYSRVLTLKMNGSSVSEGSAIDYPDLPVLYVQEHGMRTSWIIKSLVATDDGGALVATFLAPEQHTTSPDEFHAYRNRGGAFEGIGSAGCLHPDVVEVQQ